MAALSRQCQCTLIRDLLAICLCFLRNRYLVRRATEGKQPRRPRLERNDFYSRISKPGRFNLVTRRGSMDRQCRVINLRIGIELYFPGRPFASTASVSSNSCVYWSCHILWQRDFQLHCAHDDCVHSAPTWRNNGIPTSYVQRPLGLAL